jgi:hypothetical protein
MSQYWIANEPGSTVTAAQADYIAIVARAITSTAQAALLGLHGGINASVAEINNKVDGSASYVVLNSTGAVAYSVLAANTGKIHFTPDCTANSTLTLPAVAAGLNYKFIYAGGAADASNLIIDSGADANFFIGGIVHLDLNSTATTITVGNVFSDGDSNSIFTLVTPSAGTVVEILCDGTNWHLWGQVVSDTIPTMADQA